jgi:hypothetical protein
MVAMRTIVLALTAAMTAPAFAQVPPPAFCPSGGNCDNPAPCGSGCVDLDHDGLCDAWELAGGIDLNGDGVIDEENDVPLPGARPDRPDVYLQYDYMVLPGRHGHSHRPHPQAIRAVVEAFARQGIALHAFPGRPLPHSAVVTFDPVAPACNGNDAVGFYELKARSFDSRRDVAYHYAVFGHYNRCDSPEHCSVCPAENGFPISFGTGGKAELPGNDVLVATGPILDAGVTPGIEHDAGLFMHELGHNFGLRHGGDHDTPDFTPNYLSVMNNNFVYVGIRVAERPGSADPIPCRVSADCPAESICGSFGRVCTRVDYSRQALPTLDEEDLDENAGIGGTTNDITTYNCPDFTPAPAPTSGPIDWNCNGDRTETRVAADINADGYTRQPASESTFLYDPFVGHRDWGSLNFHFQCWPGYGPPR